MFLKTKPCESIEGQNLWLKQLSYAQFARIVSDNATANNYDQGSQLIYESVYLDESGNTRYFSSPDAAATMLPVAMANALISEILAFNGVKTE